MSKVWKVIDLLQAVTEFLTEKNIENPRLNAELMLGKVLNLKRVDLYLSFERPLTANELNAYREMVRRRANHEPLQYILGQSEFMGLDFKVSPAVLIPRPETEVLVEEVLKLKRRIESKRPTIVDIGSGSGCLAVSIAHHWPQAVVYATDVSAEALQIARENAERHALQERVNCVQHDLFEEWNSQLPTNIDVLVSNPPYVTQQEMADLPKEVAQYEPQIALTDGGDGLRFYRRIFQLVKENNIIPQFIFLEMSGSQPQKIVALAREQKIGEIEVINDLNNIQRVLKIKASKK